MTFSFSIRRIVFSMRSSLYLWSPISRVRVSSFLFALQRSVGMLCVHFWSSVTSPLQYARIASCTRRVMRGTRSIEFQEVILSQSWVVPADHQSRVAILFRYVLTDSILSVDMFGECMRVMISRMSSSVRVVILFCGKYVLTAALIPYILLPKYI